LPVISERKRSLIASIVIFFISMLLLLSGCYREESPVIPKNHKPGIINLTAGKDSLAVNSTTTLKCIAQDDDKDSLTYIWSCSKGFLSGDKGSIVNWTAPSTEGADTIFVTVSDTKESTRGQIVIITGIHPTIPLLLKPFDLASEIDLPVKLQWRAAKGIGCYDLQVSAEKDFSNLMINKKGLLSTSYKIKFLKDNSSYYWRVRAKNIFGISKWSKVFTFKTLSPPLAPKLTSPIDAEKNLPLTVNLNWERVKNAENYTVQVSKDKMFSSFVINLRELKDTCLNTNGLDYFGSYYWRVCAVNNHGSSNWSEAREFFTTGIAPKAPELLSPSNGAADVPRSIKLTWHTAENAVSYSLQVSDNGAFSDSIRNITGLTSTYFKLDSLSNTKKYYWRIKAVNDYGSSGWSNAYMFTTLLPAPKLYFPVNKAEDISPSPILSWDSVAFGNSYSLQVATDSMFNKIVYNESDITTTIFDAKGLSSFTKYYWRVKAANDLAISEWTVPQSFTVSSYFYKNLPYGIQADYNPIYVILNGGYDMIQVGNQRDIKNFPYNIATKNIWRNLSDPFRAIRDYGWWDFISDQVLPLSLNKKNGQFWPNYTLHLIGGGMEYAAMKEWYEYYHYPYAPFLSALTIMSYHLLNETVENGDHVGDDVDPIADIYLFDIGGIVLFSSESVKRFFSEDLNLADWSQQPSFSLRNGELHNNGQFFSVKWKFPFLKSWYAFYYFGTNGVGGLSYKYEDGSAISVGFGLAASDLVVIDEKTNKKTLGLVGNLGVFYDKNNSLLASVSLTVKTDYMVNVNIYPGIIKLWGISPGLWGAYSQNGNMILGFTISWLPFGFAQSFR
jgi:hypothetical protein